MHEKNGIELISLSVIVDGHEYKDQVDISTKQLYDYLRDGKFLQQVSQIQVILLNKWKNGKKKIMKQSLLLPALQIYQEQTDGFHLAKDTVGLDNVYIYDSRQVGAPVMDMAICAKQLADEGKTVDEIFTVLEEKTNHSFFVPLSR